MGYVLDSTTIDWAIKRAAELKSAEDGLNAATKGLAKSADLLNEAANLMDNQPESDMVRECVRELAGQIDELTRNIKLVHADMVDLFRAISECEEKCRV